MILNILILIVFTVLAGLSYYTVKKKDGAIFSAPLVFAGSYLFSITIIHILPELFTDSEDPFKIGVILLVGFFLQHLLEYFTSGVEHGHVHHHDHDHQHQGFSAVGLLIALCIHALLEGALLSHPSSLHDQHESHTILFGIILHKMPAAFALISVMSCQYRKKTVPILFLLVFSLMSPLGLLLSNLIDFESQYVSYIFALVSGSFLHISTTIFVESNPGHKTNLRKILLLLSGVVAALLVESL
ncbi:MAG: ZIP family metal transporter [Cyclobacteriaceae bacterium]